MAQVQAAAEEEEIQKKRILIQYVRLKGLALAFAKFAKDVETGTVEDCETSHAALAKELKFFEYWNLKQEAVIAANVADAEAFKAKKAEQEKMVVQAQLEIEKAKAELQEARVIRQHNEEYEVVRHEIMQQPSRQSTIAECHQLEADIKRLEAESVKLDLQADKKRKQFALLMHYMNEFLAGAEDEQSRDIEPRASQQLPENAEAGMRRQGSDHMDIDD